MYDLLILGSGSTAFAAAIHARDLGKTAVMTESRTLGGTCVNRGCLPSKNLIEAARLVYDAAHPRYPGLTPAHLGVDFPALIAQKDEIIREYRDQHYTSILDEADEDAQPPIEVVPGRAVLVDPHTVAVTAADGTARQLAGILAIPPRHPRAGRDPVSHERPADEPGGDGVDRASPFAAYPGRGLHCP